MKEFLILIGVFIAIGFIWFSTGGPDRDEPVRPFLNTPTAAGGPGGTRGEVFVPGQQEDDNGISLEEQRARDALTREIERVQKQLEEVEEEFELVQQQQGISIYAGNIVLRPGSTRTDDPDREYVRLQANTNNTERIGISDWRLVSAVTGKSVLLGEASYLPRNGSVNTAQPVFLDPGDEVIINTGRSPIGVSFRTNLCTGYFGQFQRFTPSLRQECPLAEDEPEVFVGHNGFSDACVDFIERIPRCRINTRDISIGFSSACHAFINREVNYNACVDRHKGDENFVGGTWRLFLKRDDALWKNKREVILLLDGSGKTVDVISY